MAEEVLQQIRVSSAVLMKFDLEQVSRVKIMPRLGKKGVTS